MDVDGSLRYFVYGIPVNSDKLDKELRKKEALPDVLQKFKAMNVCNGVGDLDKQLILATGGYSDCGMKWRSKDCLVISVQKRCNSCMTSRKSIQQRTKRLNNASHMKRIAGALNPVDQQKILAMKLKTKREKRQNIRAQNRLKILRTCVEQQKAQTASIQQASLDEKFAKLKMTEPQRLALKEIVAMANKNRRITNI